MGNARNGNTHYVDTTGVIDSTSNLKVAGILLTATGANAVAVLQDDSSTPVTKMDIRVAASGSTESFDFSAKPIVFPNGLRVSTLTNALLTFIYGAG